MADVEYRAELDDSQVLAALRNIDRNMDKLANEGDKSFSKVSKSAKASGVQIGAIAGIVQELTRRFINLAEEAARTFIQIAAGGVKLNQQLELTQIALTNILGGNEKAAQAFLEQTRQVARRLRTDYIELADLAATILPQAKDIEATNELLEQAIILGRKAGQNATGIRIALQEALAGQFISLERRLNVPKASVERIKELAKDIGLVNALAQVLGERVEDLGLSLESMEDTAAAAFATLQAEGRRFQQIFGEPILEELKDQANAFLDTLETKGVSIERAAAAFGDLTAAVIELIGSNLNEFLLSLDFEQIERTADALNDMVAALDLLVKTIDAVPDANQELEETRSIIDAIRAALLTAAQAAALLKAFLAGLPSLDVVSGFLQFQATGDPTALIEKFNRLTKEGLIDRDAFNESIRESSRLFEQYNDKIEENRQQTEARRAAVEDDTEASLAAAQAYLEQQKRLDDLAQAEQEAAEAREKIGEKVRDAAVDLERELTKILLDQERQRIEDAIKAAQEREDIARKNVEKIEDILREHDQAISDAATDLRRDEEDIARKAARRQAEVARDEANERLGIEREFRRELQRIRDRFLFDAQEAERRNDAQAFLEAVRRRDQEIKEAKRGRAERLEDAATRAKEQREQLQEQLQYEIEDAKIANQRKLEDLQLRLQRELEEQRIRNEREIEEQELKEQRLAEQRARANQQELEDFARKEYQRLQDLQGSLSKEIEIVKHAEELKREIRVQEAQRTVDQVNAAFARVNPFGGGSSRVQAPVFLQQGGSYPAGGAVVVGEREPEILFPRGPGTVVPLSAVSPAAAQISNTFNQQRSQTNTLNMSEDIFANPVAARRLRNIILNVLGEVL